MICLKYKMLLDLSECKQKKNGFYGKMNLYIYMCKNGLDI